MTKAGGFDHNAHTLRLLTRLETPYPLHDGLNLSWETLEGLAKHNGPVANPGWALAQADAEFPLDLANWPSLEAQVAAVSDDIAYDNHDIDDGLRAGLFTLDELLCVPMVERCWRGVRDRYSGIEEGRLTSELVRDQIGRMVNDVLQETRRRTADAGVESADDVRAAGRPLAGFSEAMGEGERQLKQFLYSHMYDAPPVTAVKEKAQEVLAGLFEAYESNHELLPAYWRADAADPVLVTRRIGDFIAGMTDRYAITQYRQHIGPVELPEGF
jgi:dGTPase